MRAIIPIILALSWGVAIAGDTKPAADGQQKSWTADGSKVTADSNAKADGSKPTAPKKKQAKVLATDNGKVITTDKGQPIMVSEDGRTPIATEDGKPIALEAGKK